MRWFYPLLIWGIAFGGGVRAAEQVDYLRDIKPLLKARCYSCHGALQQKAKLRLDTAALIRKGARHGPVVQPRNAADSLLIERVSDPEESSRMPPLGKPLTTQQIALLKAWIDQGAKGPADEKPEEDPRKHWAFQPAIRPPLPVVPNLAWVRNPIDALLSAEHTKHSLAPSPPADRATLLRRVYLDLIGLPPTREELHAFLANTSTDAYEKVVDRLLDSPRYGERWARHWMDVWRYSDWYGRRSVPDVMNSYAQIWRWRDWIVRSLNEDKGYDRMVQEMLAADEIAPDDDANVVATGFLVRNWYKWNYNQWMRDNVEHTAKAFLGLTLNCCHCHDHKYDPITQKEYFQFRAFFEPLELRHDRWPGEPDPGPFRKYVYAESYGPIHSGMIRVFDEKLDAQTFMYSGGDERNRIPDRPAVLPGAPAMLGGDRLQIDAIPLPPTVVYPGLKPFVQQEELAKRRSALAAAEAELATARDALVKAHPILHTGWSLSFLSAAPPASVLFTSQYCLVASICERELTPLKDYPRSKMLAAKRSRLEGAVYLTVRAADAKLAAARADLTSLEARIAADKAKYGLGPGKIEELSRNASLAERQATLLAAKANLAASELAIAVAHAKLPRDRGRAAAIQTATTNQKAAEAAVQQADAALKKEATTYTPLSPIYPAKSTGRRRALAGWIASKNNPLTARVAVNHLWSWHFGRPLVETTFNFGRSGKRPSRPELLDWLAVELMENGWHMKHLHRLIVTSNAYRMRSHLGGPSHPNEKIDRDNRLLWHFPATRMEAEEVRDSLLWASGELDPKIGGSEIPHEQGLTVRRRSLYFAHHGESKMEFLELFDEAEPSECYRRTTSVLPQQALALSNSELTLRQGRALAHKLWAQVASSPEADAAFIQAAFEQVLGRAPTPVEIKAVRDFLLREGALFRDIKLLAAGPDGPSTDSTLRARENLVIALFNHNDFVTVR
jgi:hypothetical protein